MFQQDTETRRGRARGAVERLGSGFFAGFCLGFGSLPLLFGASFAPPRYHSEGIAGDWKAVGSYMAQAMGVIEGEDGTDV